MKEHDFGKTLKEFRKRNALTQEELAKKINVHPTTIKNWESNNCFPDLKNLCSLADVFHTSTDSLLGRTDTETICLPKLSYGERKHLFHLIQAYIDAIPTLYLKDTEGR